MNQHYLCISYCRPLSGHRLPPANGIRQRADAPSSAVAPQQDYFRVALDHLGRLDEFDPKQGMVQTAYYLNRWIEGPGKQVAWQADPDARRVAGRVAYDRSGPRTWRSGSSPWTTCGTCARRHGLAASRNGWPERPEDPDLATWLKELEKARGEPHAYELSLAARLFDWTVRNIQLDCAVAVSRPGRGPGWQDRGGRGSGDFAAEAGDVRPRLHRVSLADAAVRPRRCVAAGARFHFAVSPATDRRRHAGL